MVSDAGKKAWGYYPVGDVWLPLRCNALGQLEVDFALISFLDLNDTPAAYAGSALSGLRVNAAALAVEFADGIFDSGAAVPAAPVAGTRFLHTPVGRTVLLIYNGAAWNSIMNFGAMTVYVDNTDGTDAIDQGGAVDAGAYKTVQYAIDQIPSILGGDVIVDINDETYAETFTVRGKQLGGNYGITVRGQLQVIVADTNMTAGAQGALLVRPAVQKGAAGWVVNAYRGMLCHFTSGVNNGIYRVIFTNDAITLNLCGDVLPALPVNGDRFEILDWDTALTQGNIVSGQKNVTLQDLEFTHTTTYGLYVQQFSECYGVRLKKPEDHGFRVENLSFGIFYECYTYGDVAGKTGFYVGGGAFLQTEGCYKYGYGRGVWASGQSVAYPRKGTHIYGIDNLNRLQDGLLASYNSMINAYPAGRQIHVEWCNNGARATAIAGIVYTANVSYANNTVQEVPAGNPDYSYID